jgi:ABC-type Na+ efflux pump permease subunit
MKNELKKMLKWTIKEVVRGRDFLFASSFQNTDTLKR